MARKSKEESTFSHKIQKILPKCLVKICSKSPDPGNSFSDLNKSSSFTKRRKTISQKKKENKKMQRQACILLDTQQFGYLESLDIPRLVAVFRKVL